MGEHTMTPNPWEKKAESVVVISVGVLILALAFLVVCFAWWLIH